MGCGVVSVVELLLNLPLSSSARFEGHIFNESGAFGVLVLMLFTIEVACDGEQGCGPFLLAKLLLLTAVLMLFPK